jgi:hypothetical protein
VPGSTFRVNWQWLAMKLTSAIIVMLLCSLVSGQVAAQRQRAFVQVQPLPDTDFGVWISAGTLTSQADNCISSADSPNLGNHNKDTKLPYQVKVSSVLEASSFYLYLNGQQTSTENRRVAITFYHQDLLGGTEELLKPGVYDKHLHLGQFFD